MKKRFLTILVMALVACLCIPAFAYEELPVNPDVTGTVTIWGWNEIPIRQAEPYFYEKFPNVKIEYIPVEWGDYLTKFQTSLAAGMDLPNVTWSDRGIRARIFSIDAFEDLSQEPYNFDVTKQFPYLESGLRNDKGEVVGVEWSLNPTGYAYKRSMAQEFFGTEDPEALHELLPDWEAVCKAGLELNENSDGKRFLLNSISDVAATVFNQNTDELIVDNVINTESLKSILSILVDLRDNKCIDPMLAEGPSLNASYTDDDHMLYSICTWSPHYVFEPNDPEGAGRWGIMIPPGGAYNQGGVSFSIPKQAIDKEAAWAFINWFLVSEEGGWVNKNTAKNYTCLTSLYEDEAYITDVNPFFANQDIGEMFFKTLNNDVEIRPLNIYDPIINEAYSLAQQYIIKENYSADQALEIMVQEMMNKASELKVS